jgi:hypothetical protein
LNESQIQIVLEYEQTGFAVRKVEGRHPLCVVELEDEEISKELVRQNVKYVPWRKSYSPRGFAA